MSFCSVLSMGTAVFGIARLDFKSCVYMLQIYCSAALLMASCGVLNRTAVWNVMILCVDCRRDCVGTGGNRPPDCSGMRYEKGSAYKLRQVATSAAKNSPR